MIKQLPTLERLVQVAHIPVMVLLTLAASNTFPSHNADNTTPTLFFADTLPEDRLDALITVAKKLDMELLVATKDIPSGKITFANKNYSVEEALYLCLANTNLVHEVKGEQIRIYTPVSKLTKLRPITVLSTPKKQRPLISSSSTMSSFSLTNRIAKPIQSISQDYLKTTYSNNIENSLDYVSGIEYLESGSGINSQFYARGIPAIFTIDGNSHRRTLQTMDPFFLERIDIMQGPTINFVDQGATVNFVTKKPIEKSSNLTELSSSNDNLYRFANDVNLHFNNDSNNIFRFVTLYEKEENRRFYYDEKFGLAPSFSTSFYGDDTLLVSLYHSERSSYPNIYTYHDSVLGEKLDRDLILSTSWSNSKTTDSFFALDYSALTSKDWRFTVATNWSRYTLNSKVASIGEPLEASDYLYEQVGDAPLIQFTSKDIRYLTYGLNASLESAFDINSNTLLVKTGMDAQILDQLTPHYPAIFLDENFNIYDPDYDIAYARVDRIGQLSHEMKSLGVSTSLHYPLNDAVQINVDLRYDDTNFHLIDHRQDSEFQIFDWDIEGEFEEYSGESGISFTLSNSAKIYSSYSQSHTYQPVVNASQVDDPYYVRAEILPPIDNRQYEISLENKLLRDALILQLSWYHIKSKNIQSFGRSSDGADFINSRLRDRHSKGYSLDLKGKVSKSIDLLANYSRNQNIQGVVTAANYLNFDVQNSVETYEVKHRSSSANTVANLWMRYQATEGLTQNFSWSFGAKYVGKRYGDMDNSFTLDPYKRFDTTIEYSGFKNVEIAFSVKNIFDTYYYKSSAGARSLVELGDARTILLTFRSST